MFHHSKTTRTASRHVFSALNASKMHLHQGSTLNPTVELTAHHKTLRKPLAGFETAHCPIIKNSSTNYCLWPQILAHECTPTQIPRHATASRVIWAKLIKRATALGVHVRRLSMSISSHVGAIHSWNVHHSRKLLKTPKPPIFRVLKSFKVIDVGTIKKQVTSACYDKQYVCVYLHLFLC